VIELTGRRVTLRPHRRADVPILMEWMRDPALRRLYGGSWVPVPIDMEQRMLESSLEAGMDSPYPGTIRFGVYNVEDRLIGSAGLSGIDYVSRNATLVGGLGDLHYRGRGHAMEGLDLLLTYAFGQLNLVKVKTQIFVDNRLALSTLSHFGFRREGVLRDEHYADGRWHDLALLAYFESDAASISPRWAPRLAAFGALRSGAPGALAGGGQDTTGLHVR
jgi:RimJ/RimL family protein N-acetyltransferase